MEEGEPEAAKDFAVVINGPDMQAFDSVTEADLKSGASLRLKKSKQQIAPSATLVGRGPGNKLTYLEIHFPREMNGQPTIGADEKQVEFALTTKGESIKTAFKLNQMVTQQGPDL